METTLTKEEIAKTFLRVALDNFEKGEYLVALNNAAIAEEMFGKMIEQAKDDNYRDYAVALEQAFNKFEGVERSRKDIERELKGAKNAIKHANDPAEKTVTADWEVEAQAMIFGALFNHERLFGEYPDLPSIPEFMERYRQG